MSHAHQDTKATKREVCFLIGQGDRVLWSDASDSPVALPDSRARWRAIWALRAQITEIAHTHPIGPLAFSQEDETTMQALAAALGKRVRFSVVTGTGMLRRNENGRDSEVADEPSWVHRLRVASGITK